MRIFIAIMLLFCWQNLWSQGQHYQLSNASISTSDVLIDDLDGDGILDMIAVTSFQLQIRKGYADLTYGESINIPRQQNISFLAVVLSDIDNDDDKDLVVNGYNHFVVLENMGNLQFEFHEPFDVLDYGYSFHMEDFDIDGDSDLLALKNDTVVVLSNNGIGQFQTQYEIATGFDVYVRFEMNDMDGDGDMDVVCSDGAQQLKWYEFDGNEPNLVGEFTVEEPYRIATCRDMNLDGMMDLVLYHHVESPDPTEFGYNAIMIAYSTGGLNFEFPIIPTMVTPEGYLNSIEYQQLNDDEYLDITFGLISSPLSVYSNQAFYSNSNGQYSYHHGFNNEYKISSGVSDINQDGFTDVLVHDGFPSSGIYGWMLNSDSGDIEIVHVDESYSSGNKCASLDLDMNGHNDIVVMNSANKSVAFYKNFGDHFGKCELIGYVDGYFPSFRFGDLDGDGDLDILGIPMREGEDFCLFVNNITGFTRITFPLSLGSGDRNNFMLEDLNLDGKSDLLIVVDSKLKIFLNSGVNYFNMPLTTLVNMDYDLDLIDFDSDGDKDIVASGSSSVIYENKTPQGLGIVARSDWSQILTGFKTFEVVQINNDSLPDLVVRSSNLGYNNFVCYNTGEELLMPEDIEVVNVDPDWVDYNDDGLMDVMYTSPSTHLIYTQHESQFIPTFETGYNYAPLTYDRYFESQGWQFVLKLENQLWLDNSLISPAVNYVPCYTFLDQNQNGVHEADEEIIHLPIIGENSSNEFVVQTSSDYVFLWNLLGATISLDIDPDLWSITTDSLQYQVNSGALPTYPLIFGVYPATPNSGVSLESTAIDINCGEENFYFYAELENTGNVTLNGVLQIVFNVDSFPVLFANQPYLENGDILEFEVLDLLPTEELFIMLNISHPGISMMDSSFYSVIRFDEGTWFEEDVYQELIQCAYDPNSIEVSPVGIFDQHFIMPGDTLTYTINFQNLGTAAASKVKLTDNLPDGLDFMSLKVIQSSHEIDILSTSDGYLLIELNDIDLLPASTDSALSMGFVIFEIVVEEDIEPMHSIHNMANIYFDLNPPIQTNTCFNTIIDCNLLYGLNDLPDAVCAGDAVHAGTSGHYISDYYWSQNDMVLEFNETMQVFTDNEGFVNIELTATNDLCEVQESSSILIHPSPVTELIFQGDELFATGNGPFIWTENQVPLNDVDNAINFIPSMEYCVHVVNHYGCSSNVDCLVPETICQFFAPELYAPQFICPGSSVMLSAAGGDNYLWPDGSVGDTYEFVANEPTEVLVEISTNNFCSATLTSQVDFYDTPELTITANGPELIANGGANAEWFSPENEVALGIGDVFTPAENGYYFVKSESVDGCELVSDTIHFLYFCYLFTPSISPDQTVCPGNSVVLEAQGGDSYQWSNGASGSLLEALPLSNTIYELYVATDNGCSDTLSTSVTLFDLQETQVMFNGSSLEATSGNDITWYETGSTDPFGTGEQFAPNQSGNYYYSSQSENGCAQISDTLSFDFCTTLFAPALIGETTICPGESATLQASGGDNYAWSTGFVGDVYEVNPEESTTYEVYITTSGGCADTLTAVVDVSELPQITVAIDGNTINASDSPADANVTWVNALSNEVIGNGLSVVPDENGFYFAITENEDLCTIYSDTLEYLYYGIEVIGSSPLHIYPNPGSDWIMITGEESVVISEVSLYDLGGRQIHASMNTTGSGIYQLPSHLSAGAYIISITCEDDSVLRMMWVRE